MAENVACMRMMGSACGINRFLACKESAVYETSFAWENYLSVWSIVLVYAGVIWMNVA